MSGTFPTRAVVLVCVGSLLGADSLGAQDRAIDLTYGRWWYESGGSANTFSASFRRPLFGPLAYGLGVTHIDDQRPTLDRTQSGGEVSLVLAGGRGFYGVAAGGLGMRHNDGRLAAQWSAGAGYALQPLPLIRLSVEARYRVEDQRAQGFWQLDPADRRGFMLQAGVAIRTGGGRTGGGGRTVAAGTPRGPDATAPERPPSSGEIAEIGRSAGADRDVAALAAVVVQTAIDVMGAPYEWGGTDENGFDCSGLIQYAYAQHGIILPRVSRAQIRQGDRVEARPEALRPGDILGFSVEGNGVSHVGLYVGDGQFIHSSSQGVRLSSLTASDGNSRWWQQRWVSARRILN